MERYEVNLPTFGPYREIGLVARPSENYNPEREVEMLGEFFQALHQNIPNVVAERLRQDSRFRKLAGIESIDED